MVSRRYYWEDGAGTLRTEGRGIRAFLQRLIWGDNHQVHRELGRGFLADGPAGAKVQRKGCLGHVGWAGGCRQGQVGGELSTSSRD